MRASSSIAAVLRAVGRPRTAVRQVRLASTAMRMPAMSPTMTEGGITAWKKREGETFGVGDVLLEVETDKATIDVEAQDDGVMGKIIAEAGSSKIPVGQVIAVLAEEGDDLSKIEVPKDLGPEGGAGGKEEKVEMKKEPPAEQVKEAPSEAKDMKGKEAQRGAKGQTAEASSGSSKGKAEQEEIGGGHEKSIRHARPLFPSVQRLLLESSLTSEQIRKLKGTGKNGMLTKGDVLVALGQIRNAFGSAEKLNLDIMGPSGKRKSELKAMVAEVMQEKEEPLDGPALRRSILAGMGRATRPVQPFVEHLPGHLALSTDTEFDDILAPYAALLPAPQPALSIPGPDMLAEMESQGVPPQTDARTPATQQDEWAGLF